MPTTIKPADEEFRLQELGALQLLESLGEPAFDNLTRLASDICETPVALISMIDRNRVLFVSRVGFDDFQAPRTHSFCSHAIEDDVPLIVEDASLDSRFQLNEFVRAPQGIRFYAGIPLVLKSGSTVGSLCVLDHKARTLSAKQLACLKNLAVQAVALIEARRTHLSLMVQERNSLASEQRLDFAMNTAEIGVWDRDLKTNMTFRSLVHDRIFGYQEAVSEWSCETFLAHVLEPDRDEVDRRYKRARVGDGLIDAQYRVAWPDGSIHWLWTRGRFYFDAQGQPVKASGIVIDISERKNSEESMRESEYRHRSMFENNPNPMWVFDAQTLAFLSVNDATVEKYGYSAEEFLQMTLHDIRPAEDLSCLNAQLEIDLQSRATKAQTWTHIRKDGTPIQVEISAHSMHFQGRPARLVLAHDITERLKSQARVEHLAYHDTLTGLANRAQFLNVANQILAASHAASSVSACILFDLDHFKRINDQWGHRCGDELLKMVSLRVMNCLPQSTFLARLGGDEFIVMAKDIGKDKAEASETIQNLCNQILQSLSQSFLIDQNEHFTSCSLGIALVDGSSLTVDELLKRADSAMYSAKADGRNTYRFFDGQLQAELVAQSELERDLRRSIQNDELHLVYQPQVDQFGTIVGSEALLRWTHPQRGVVSPAQFIPVAESSGIILQIGQWVLRVACSTLAHWQQIESLEKLTLAVNVSAKQFHHPDFVNQVLTELDRSGANPAFLKLELTESLLAQDLDGIVQKMNAIKARGVTFSLDDFGTGYSSLAYLKRLPLDQLKIDQGFVRDVLDDASDAAIVRTVIALGDRLSIKVIAEGVETQEQKQFLESNGCNLFQGYLFSRPLKMADFEAFCTQP